MRLVYFISLNNDGVVLSYGHGYSDDGNVGVADAENIVFDSYQEFSEKLAEYEFEYAEVITPLEEVDPN
jgi:hypothetical protein